MLLSHVHANAPGAEELMATYDNHMAQLGYDVQFTDTDYTTGDGRAWATISPRS